MHVNFIKSDIGFNLDKMMNEKGITQAELSRLTGISKPTICGYVSGDIMPSLINMVNICKCLDCKLSDIVSVNGYVYR